MSQNYYIGVMSGTSMDSIDVVLCEVSKTSCQLIDSLGYEFPLSLKEEITSYIQSPLLLQHIGALHQQLGVLFAKAVNALIEKQGIDPERIVAIGSHGQTLWHAPEGTHPFSMQLGDPNVMSTQTGISVVADFRSKDIALGGQGAPLAPAFHQFLFGAEESIAVVNIGGMANITVLGKPLLGYDTGCGNVLLDTWITKHLGQPYDKDGAWAMSGTVSYPLLESMLDEPYFSQNYPKSTGREIFNLSWIEKHLEGQTLPPEDIQRTLLELTALSISNEVLQFNKDLLVLCGGGAKNSFLVERLAILMPNIHIMIAKDADMLEAMMMAWLAYKRLHNEHIPLKEVTGARQNGILGGIYR